ncbi:hypothetical protein Hanom_Chr11g01062841 [Helianthus anomalus]
MCTYLLSIKSSRFVVLVRLDGMGTVSSTSRPVAALHTILSGASSSQLSGCGHWGRSLHDKTPHLLLTHIYTYNSYVYTLGPSLHFLSFIPFAPSSHPSYVALTWWVISGLLGWRFDMGWRWAKVIMHIQLTLRVTRRVWFMSVLFPDLLYNMHWDHELFNNCIFSLCSFSFLLLGDLGFRSCE